ncbi:glycosyltransferase [Fibrella sp. ES10-3-2-2]|nr:hypothetical protein A6C57_07350 [Fibrella sp. ES10-3-2-2]
MGRKIRILETIRQGQVGGGESHLLDLVNNLDRTEFEPVVLSFTEGPMIDRLQKMQVPVTVIGTTRPFDVTKWKAVRTFIEQQRIDLVHAHGTRAASNVFWAAGQLQLPLIYTVHGWSFHDDQPYLVRQIRTAGERLLIRKAAKTISVSASNQQTGQKLMPAFESVVINNGIDTRRFDPSRAFPDIRAELGINPAAVLLVFVARFTHQKQPLALLNAFAQLAAQNPNLHLLMVGDGEQRAEALALLAQLSCKNQITLLPFRQDVPAVLAAADIYVLPSLWEGLSIALLEAMSMGKAIIASKTDGTTELIADGQNGLLIELNDLTRQLVTAIQRLGNNPALRSQLGRAARQTVLTGYDAVSMASDVAQIYRQLTGQIGKASMAMPTL